MRSPGGSLGDCIVHRVRRTTSVLFQIQVHRFGGSYMVSTQALATHRAVLSLAALKGLATLLTHTHRFCKSGTPVLY